MPIQPKHRSTLFMTFSVIVFVAAIVLMGVIQQIINARVEKARHKDDSGLYNSTIARSVDPLVTVVPKEILGGKPHPLVTDPQRGATKPTVTIIEFGDFECQNCAAMSGVIAQIVAEYPSDVLHVWKDFPLPNVHPYAEDAAVAARCAQDQGAFWQYHDVLLQKQSQFVLGPWVTMAGDLGLDTDIFTTCLSDTAKKSMIVQGYFIAKSLDVDEAPTYYINNRIVSGIQTYDDIKKIVQDEIDHAQK
ncbi:MAG: thioredoxin domain-containing protein [Candidatus Kerfeldbacteria bacterium]|nr:thioredoxin domain-containing protein [Candidatus Kerfeldbacteria bacterium]